MKLSTSFLLMFVLISTLSFAQLPTYVPVNGLVGYYGFNGNVNDASINNNSATVYGATLTTDRFGNNNSAYSFDGISNYLALSFKQSRVAQYSISAWFKTTTGGTIVGTNAILSGTPGDNLSVKLYMHDMHTDPVNPYQMVYAVSGTGYACGSRSRSTYNDNNWHHIVGIWNGTSGNLIDTSQFTLYIDGVVVSQHGDYSVGNGGSTGPLSAPTTDTAVFVVGENMTFNSWFQGSIDDIALYNRPLTACEVYRLYTSGSLIIKDPINDTVIIGNNAAFSISSGLNGGLYQWQVDAGTGFTNLTNAGVYSGVNTDTLKISSTALNMNNNQYRCIIYGNCSDTSENASLIVKNNTGLSELEKNETVTILPNPASNYIKIQTPENIDAIFIDMSGRQVKKSTLKVIDVSDLANGIYILNIRSLNKIDMVKLSILH